MIEAGLPLHVWGAFVRYCYAFVLVNGFLLRTVWWERVGYKWLV